MMNRIHRGTALLLAAVLVLALFAAGCVRQQEDAPIPTAPPTVPTEPETQMQTEPSTEALTETPTEHPTEAPTEAPTERPTEAPTEAPTERPTERPTEAPTEAPTERPTEAPTEAPTERPTETPTEAPTERPTEAPTEAPTEVPTEVPTEAPTEPVRNVPLIAIDAGHQRRGNYEKEPIGPGSSVMKARVTSGTEGVVSGWAEYELNLVVALKLQAELQRRGYQVIMIRTTHDVDISNAERAAVANAAKADAFIRIHANGSENPDRNGAMTICQTPSNPFNANLYRESRALSDCVLDAFVAATGCRREYVWETDTMSGINWCQVPVTIVEMGYMSNPAEDALMATEAYQDRMVQGIANGIDRYIANR